MNSATKTKMISGFEKSDDFAQLAILQGNTIYRRNNPDARKGRIKKFFDKK